MQTCSGLQLLCLVSQLTKGAQTARESLNTAEGECDGLGVVVVGGGGGGEGALAGPRFVALKQYTKRT